MANVNQTTVPDTLISLKNIRPAFNEIIFGYNTEFLAGIQFPALYGINFSSVYGGGTDFTALDGDSITIAGEKIFFRDNPKFGELTSSAFSSRQQATLELYRILILHPTLKNKYQTSLVYDSPNYQHIILVAKLKTELLEIIVTLSAGISNIFLDSAFNSGSSNYYGGDTPNWSMFVQLFAVTDNAKRDLMDTNPFSPTLIYENILLEKQWEGLIDNNVDNSPEKIINFDFSVFLRNFVSVDSPFNQAFKFQLCKNAIVRYYYIYGEKLNGIYYEIAGNTFKRYAHYSELSHKINPYSRLPVSDSVYLTNDLDTAFLRYWRRGLGVVASPYNLVDFLTNQPENVKIQIDQVLFLSFIYDYVKFNNAESEGVKQNTKIFLEFDLYFVDGTSILGTDLNRSLTTVSYFTQNCVEATLDMALIDFYEAAQVSQVEKIVYRVKEYKATELQSTARNVTNDITFVIDNEHRDFKANSRPQILFLNKLGGWDSLVSLGDVSESTTVETTVYEKNKLYPNQYSIQTTLESNNDVVDREILEVNNDKTITFQTDYLNKEKHAWLLELLESEKVFYYVNSKWIRVQIISTDYTDVYSEDMQRLTLQLKPLLDV